MNVALHLVKKYEERYREYGDSHLALGWQDPERVQKRYEVMFDVVETYPASILDYGCGLGHFYDYIQTLAARKYIIYAGYDISKVFLKECRKKYPRTTTYWQEHVIPPESYDYVVMNGLFTEKLDVPHAEFWEYAKDTIERAWGYTRKALAVNFMSTHLDYERPDLFHLPLDTLASFLHDELSRSFRIRHDYGLWEYTAYVYKTG